MAGIRFSKQAFVSMLLLSLLVHDIVHVQSSGPVLLGNGRSQFSGSCNTPDACTRGLTNLKGILEPCLSAARGTSTPSPGGSCCNGITSLDPSCLCKALQLALSFDALLHLNTTATLAMPKECGYDVPQNCICDGYPVPPTVGASFQY